MDKAFSSIDLVGQCLLDKERTLKFKEAIERVIGNGSVAVDVGTGSGIMAIFAAKAGAAKVFAIEFDEYVSSVARSNFENNGLAGIELITADARSTKLPMHSPADVLIMEMLTTGMIDEFQVPALKNLQNNGHLTEQTIIIPQRQQSFISLGVADFNFEGAYMAMPLHVWDIHAPRPRFRALTPRLTYDDYNFHNLERETVSFSEIIEINSAGSINSVLLESRTILDEHTSLDETPALNGKVIIPIKEIEVAANSKVKVELSYPYGGGFEKLKVSAEIIS
jgi:predicted RNA methylase